MYNEELKVKPHRKKLAEKLGQWLPILLLLPIGHYKMNRCLDAPHLWDCIDVAVMQLPGGSFEFETSRYGNDEFVAFSAHHTVSSEAVT